MIAVEIAINIEKIFTHSFNRFSRRIRRWNVRRDEQISNDASSFGIPID
jgi:hypothetical protein